MKKKLFVLLFIVSLFTGCDKENRINLPDQQIVIMFESDVHCAVDNYAAFAARRSEFAERTPYIATVSSGDFVQGEMIGATTKGEAIIDIMNFVGYDFVTLGNHEFDYGVHRTLELSERLNAKVLDCNIVTVPDGKLLFEPYAIKSFGKTKVAFIGITTPRTMVSAPAGTFNDENGVPAYDFCGDNLNSVTQKYIDEVKSKGADFVIVLAHLGDVVDRDPNTSLTLIEGTSGIDVVLDAHAHNLIPGLTVTDKDGNDVLLTATGKNMPVIGALEISTAGEFTVNFTETATYSARDEAIQSFVDNQIALAESRYDRVIGYTDFPLYFKEDGIRTVRVKEAPLGNLVADAFRSITNLDAAIVNASAFRGSIEAGNITINDVIGIDPFLNKIVASRITGQQLLDGLEFAVSSYPKENSAFLQVSGISFTFDPSKKAELVMDEYDQFVKVAEGSERRVSNVLIQENGAYSPVDPAKVYTVAGTDYTFMNKGNSGIFQFAKLVEETGISDFEAITDYIENTLGGVIPERYRQPEGRIVRK